MRNSMPEVAALLGVEIGEEFDVSERPHSRYKITKYGLVGCDTCCEGDEEIILSCLLTGEWEIVEKPWEPKNGETYWYVCPDGDIECENFGGAYPQDHAMVYAGNSFRTERKAEINRPAIMEKFGWK